MARTDTTKIECPVHLCHTFLTDTGDFDSPTPIVVQDTLVVPLNVIEGGRAVVGYDIPKLRVEKVFAENWVSGDKVYYSFSLAKFTKDDTLDDLYSAGIVIKSSSRGTGFIHFVSKTSTDVLSILGDINMNDNDITKIGTLYLGENNEASISFDGTDLNINSTNPSLPGAIKINDDLTTTAGRIKNTTRYTTTQTIPITDDIVFANTDGSAWTATLPTGVEGQTLKIVNSGSSGNLLTVAPNGAEYLLGVNSNFILFDGESLFITYNATDGWY